MDSSQTDTAARAAALAPFVELALGAVHREYPCHLSITLTRDEDLAPPRTLTPAFFGCFDWHSAVHGHWCLARAARRCPDAQWAPRARAALAKTLTHERLAGEAAFLRAPGREGFERPYGLAWLLQLAAELRGWPDVDAARWSESLAPLEALAAARLSAWVEKLPVPVRSGEHSQSAFAMGLFNDWARDAGDATLATRVREHSLRLHGADHGAPVRFEPSAHDFLSPLLAEADLLRRAMPAAGFGSWLARFLPPPGGEELRRWLEPVVSPDPTDGKFAHLDGLNLSRAWMLDGVLSALPVEHPHRENLSRAARSHRDAGLEGALNPHYMGSHWLGSFAVYLLTRRGLG